MAQWEKCLIDDVIVGLYDGPHATPKPSMEGPVFLGIKNLTEDGRIKLDEIRHISEGDFTQWTRRILPEEDDMVFTYEATLNRYGLIPRNLRCCLGRRMALLRLDKNKVDPRFLLYYFFCSEWRQIIQQNLIVGATVNRIPIAEFSSFPIRIPGLSQQKQIAKVLSDLDAKIDLNNRINAELEGMAKLIYDYWFVQFDFPISVAQAQAMGKPELEGMPYKSSGGKMVFNGELRREIPEGWEIKELGDIANITMGQSPSGSSYNDEGVGTIFFQGSTDYGWRFPKIRQYTTEPSRRASVGDILLSVRAPVGTLNVADNDCCIGRGLAALNSKDGATSYLFYVMVYFKQIFDRRNTAGTTFGSITKDDLYSLKLVYPSNEYLEKYDSIVSNYNRMILINHKQNQELSSLRDWLLPMLMNGQVKVGEPAESLSMAAEPEVNYGG